MDITNSTMTSGNFTQNVNNQRPAGPNGTPPPPPHHGQGQGHGQGDTVQLGHNNQNAPAHGYNAHGTQGAHGHTPPPPPQHGQMQGAQGQQMQLSPEGMNLARSQGAYAPQNVNGATPPPPASSINSANGDTVQLSHEGVLRQEAFNVAMATPEVRQDRVDALRQQVQNGTYQINSRELANNLVRDEAAFAAIS